MSGLPRESRGMGTEGKSSEKNRERKGTRNCFHLNEGISLLHFSDSLSFRCHFYRKFTISKKTI